MDNVLQTDYRGHQSWYKVIFCKVISFVGNAAKSV
jgi:hypothetical protein